MNNKMAQFDGFNLDFNFVLVIVLFIMSLVSYCPARILPTPRMAYGQNGSTFSIPYEGVWNMGAQKFLAAKDMIHFGIISVAHLCEDSDINAFVSALTRAGQEKGKPATVDS